MKKCHTDQFKHLPPEQQYQCLQALKNVHETSLRPGVLGLAVSVMMTDGQRVTVSKFSAQDVSVMLSWE